MSQPERQHDSTEEQQEEKGHPARGLEGNAIRALIRNRSFSALWVGQLLSQTGDRFRFIAILVIVNNLTGGDPLAITALAFTIVVPQFAFGLVGGAVSDRFNRKTVMIVSDVLRGVFSLPILLANNPSHLYLLYIASIGLEVISVFFYPARNAAIPNIVGPGRLMAANALMQGSYIVALIIGAVLAGYLTELLGTDFAIVFDSATFFFSAGMIGLMTIPPVTGVVPGTRPTFTVLWGEIKAGLHFIRGRRDLVTILVIAVVAMLGLGQIVVLGVSYLEQRLNVQAAGYGNTFAAVGLGILIGGLLVSRIAGRVRANVLVGGSLLIVGAAIIAFAGAGNYIVVILAAAIIGLCLVIARASLDTFTQALVPDEMLGRVQAAVQMTQAVGTALAQGLAGVLAELLKSVENVFILAGGVTVIAGLAAIFTLRDAAEELAKSQMMRGPGDE
jgi:DHA3 family macrolide efflux protein-like MFS transporter